MSVADLIGRYRDTVVPGKRSRKVETAPFSMPSSGMRLRPNDCQTSRRRTLQLIALAIVEKDGVAAILGILTGIVSLVIVAGVVIAMIKGFILFLERAFS